MIIESVTSIAIIVIAVIFTQQPALTMPMSMQSLLVLGLILAFFTFAGLILQEKPKDEREAHHSRLAARFAYLAGVGTLIVAVITQAFEHNVDPWIVAALAVMISVKLLVRVYCHHKL